MNRTFYTLWTGRSVANLANSLWIMTWIALVYETTGSTLLAGAITFIRSVAVLGSGLSLPYWYRRWSLPQVAKIFQNLQFILSLIFSLLTILIYDHAISVTVIAILAAVLTGYASGCAASAASAMYPRIVDKEHWVRSNNLITTGTQMISLLGWSAGGILIAKLGQVGVFQACVVLLLVSCFFQARIQTPTADSDSSTDKSKPRSWWSSWSVLFKHPHIRIITIMDVIEGIAAGIWIGAVTLVFVKEVLHQSEAWWGYINAAYYAGSLLGGLLLLPLSKYVEQRLVPSILLGSFCFSLILLVYAWNTQPYWALALVLVMGPCYQLRDIAQRTYIQRIVPLQDQPELFAAQQSLSTILFGLSVLFSAGIADLWGAKMVYILGGFMCMTSSLLGLWLRFKSTRVTIQHTTHS